MNIQEKSIATIRSIGIDMINKAKSGHPGMVLGSAPAMYALFTNHLNATPEKSDWINRDRFVLASGHASSLLYTMLHLSGFDVTMQDLMDFRQWGSRTPGHPEVGVTDGVDASSGPLGQGIPMAVGMAATEKFLSTTFNTSDYNLINHYTYVLCGDGDMQEGVTYEATSLAGHWSLGKLIVIYDSNKVTLDGSIDLSFSEDVKKRYEAIGWQVLVVEDGNNIEAINKAIKKAKNEQFKPTLIIMSTVIGYGSPKQGTSSVHGAPLGDADGKITKEFYGHIGADFEISKDVYEDFANSIQKRSLKAYKKWNKMFKEYQKNNPELANEFKMAISGENNYNLEELLPKYEVGYNNATRNISEQVINSIASFNKVFMSGAADLASSTKTAIKNEKNFSPENYGGRNICFGIREFAMVAIMNGMMLHKGVRVSGGGFMAFSDYFKGALRMSCLMELPVIIPLSHDSIAVGEDGPTHQPTEQLSMLRAITNMQVIRPCDANETVAAWRVALETKNQPTAIILTRQNVVNQEATCYDGVNKGAYVISYEGKKLDGILLAAGSEVGLAMEAKKALAEKNIDVRVVSIPSMNRFDAMSDSYKESVLPNECRTRLAIEMGSSFGWHKYVGLDGDIISVEKFGASAPAEEVIKQYGFTVENVVNTFKTLKK